MFIITELLALSQTSKYNRRGSEAKILPKLFSVKKTSKQFSN